jgi:hypothetical protein
MNNLKDRNFNPDTIEGEYPVALLWSQWRTPRIIAGVFAGIVAGTAMQIAGMIYCSIRGWDIFMPGKISALPWLGREALQFGSVHALVVGLIAFYALAIVLGMAYAHFTGNNHRGVRFGMGVVWATWGWVFITCLFSPSFQAYQEADIPRGAMFFAWLVFGLSLSSVAWFDKNAPQRPVRKPGN